MILGSLVASQRSKVFENGASQLQPSIPVTRMPPTGEPLRRFAADTTTRMNVSVGAVHVARTGVHEHDIHRLQLVANTLEFGLDIRRGCHVAVIEMAEVQLHARPEIPIERHLVDRRHRIAVAVAGVVMIGRVHMRAIVSRERDVFDRPALASRQVLFLQSREQLDHELGVFFARDIADRRPHERRIDYRLVVERLGDIDEFRRHFHDESSYSR